MVLWGSLIFPADVGRVRVATARTHPYYADTTILLAGLTAFSSCEGECREFCVNFIQHPNTVARVEAG